MSLTESIIRTKPHRWLDESRVFEIKGPASDLLLKLSLRGFVSEELDSTNDQCHGNELKLYALEGGADELERSNVQFDACVDALVSHFPSRVLVTFLRVLFEETIEYARKYRVRAFLLKQHPFLSDIVTKDPLVIKAVRYYGYCRLTHAFLRGLCYEGCNDGFGVGVWIRGTFNFHKASVAFKTQILAFASRRTAKLERDLFEEIQKRIKKHRHRGLVPTLLALGILVDQLDCNIHEGVWLSKPGKNLVVCSQPNYIVPINKACSVLGKHQRL
jgi:hypothetical protein